MRWQGPFLVAVLATTALAGYPAGASPANVKVSPATGGGVDAVSEPDYINVQGLLTDLDNTPIVGLKSVLFGLYTSATGPVPYWSQTQSVDFHDGVFDVQLGPLGPLPQEIPEDGNCYLEMEVIEPGSTPISPRTRIVSAAYAWNAAGLTSNQEGICRANGYNAILGNDRTNHVNLGWMSTTGSPGGDDPICTVGGGQQNTASALGATVSGGWQNTSSGQLSFVGGGWMNTAGGLTTGCYAGMNTVGGGRSNTANADFAATVGGGDENTASSLDATVGGGVLNTASGVAATIAGGSSNAASGAAAFVGGGQENLASATSPMGTCQRSLAGSDNAPAARMRR